MKFSHKIDTRFKYTPAAATDIRQSINRERRRLAEIAEREAKRPKATVRELKQEKGKA